MKNWAQNKNILKWILTGVLVALLFIAANSYLVPPIQFFVFRSVLKQNYDKDLQVISYEEAGKIKGRLNILEKRVSRLAPGVSFLIVNTTDNSFQLYKDRRLIRTGLCSTGSFIQLEADSTRSWLFETPKGIFTVLNKITDPVWRKPDWAFIEEGLVPPPPDHPSRFERGVLGDYALDIGNGYLIHGTLYQRLMGKSVTHGCIRLKDEDLKMVYNTLKIGSKVYIH